ncbi:MAG: tripartite tricarboxylate transporter TctB family protein [Hyphomicrobiaceae bacterium]
MTSNGDGTNDKDAGTVVPKQPAVFVVTLVIMVCLGYLFYETYNMAPPLLPGYPGDAFFPRLVLGFTMFWGAIVLLRGITASAVRSHYGSDIRFHIAEFIFVVAIGVAYGMLLEPIGFELATFAFLLILLLPRLKVDLSWQEALAVGTGLALLTMLILWAAFGLGLKVQLPLKVLPLYIQ